MQIETFQRCSDIIFYYILHCQHECPRLWTWKLNKQIFSATEVSDCVDCHWEGFIKGGEWWQSMAMPWRKEHLDRLDGDLPQALLRNRRNSCPWHIHCTQISMQARRQTCIQAVTCRWHADPLRISLSIVAWGLIFAWRDAIPKDGQKKSTSGHRTNITTSRLLCDRWNRFCM